MPLFEVHEPVKVDEVSDIVRDFWGITVSKLIKGSQNSTFAAADEETGRKYAVRVTPDVANKHYGRICDEMTFVEFLHNVYKLPGVCAPVRPSKVVCEPTPEDASSTATEAQTGKKIQTSTVGRPHHPAVVCHGHFIIVVFEWAHGKPVDFGSYRWMLDESLVRAWGSWLATLHAGSRSFMAECPVVAKRMRNWDQVHEAILAGAALHPSDAAAAQNPEEFGVLHGDCNVSNFFVLEGEQGGAKDIQMSVFDWDQVQLGWWEFDVTQVCIARRHPRPRVSNVSATFRRLCRPT